MHKESEREKQEVELPVFSCKSVSHFLSADTVKVFFGGGVGFPCCRAPGQARGWSGLIWALIPSPLPGDPRTNLM